MKRILAGMVAAALAGAAMPASLSEAEISTAANNFIARDAIGSKILKDQTLRDVEQYGRLWIVNLDSSGHIIFNGSDRLDPVVGFSKDDFVVPEDESPAKAVLDAASENVAEAEASESGERHARWNKLLSSGNASSRLLAAADSPASDAIVVEPFMTSHFNQWQPYNDFSPIYNSDVETTYYRGRCPCGCVATAAAGLLHHFRWPARLDATFSHNHNFTDEDGDVSKYPLRFDGNIPIEWDLLQDEYDFYWSDMRGNVSETVRYPISRLIFWCDVMGKMSYKPGGSGASYGSIATALAPWWTTGRWIADLTDSAITDDLAAGIPLQVTLSGHQVVAHGWASDSSTSYIYLNFGWGGSNDGYYNIDNSTISMPINSVYVGHYPRAKPQIEPLPTVCDKDVTLKWCFPDLYSDSISGFIIRSTTMTDVVSDFKDDFSSVLGESSHTNIYVGTDSDYGRDGNLLFMPAYQTGNYTYPDAYMLTGASVITFKLFSCYTLNATLKIQAQFDGGDWETVAEPTIIAQTGNSGWSTERVYLGGYGGCKTRFRIRNEHSGSWYPAGRILIDDFCVSNAIGPTLPDEYSVGKCAREFAIPGLEGGRSYSFDVTPVVSTAGFPVDVETETSDAVNCTIEGDGVLPLPGEEYYIAEDTCFSTNDTSEVWSYSGAPIDYNAVNGFWNCSVAANLAGKLGEDSILSFSWRAQGYYGDDSSYDALSAVFTSKGGSSTILWCVTNRTKIAEYQRVEIPLGVFKEQSGSVSISASHAGPQYASSDNGVFVCGAKVLNYLSPREPEIEWGRVLYSALGTTEIESVALKGGSAPSEGFYAEKVGAFSLVVECSENVTSLKAYPSHLSVVADEDVSVRNLGEGKFSVRVAPSGLTEDNSRTRMILTLAATDANGTTAYKNLSLRLEAGEGEKAIVVDATDSAGNAISVDIPYEWLEEHGVVSSGSDDTSYQSALSSTADFDGDGIPNWVEYVCGTDPADEDEKFEATIRMEDGRPVVECSVSGERILSGFTIVTKGTDNLSLPVSEWETVTDSKTSSFHYFRVEILAQ